MSEPSRPFRRLSFLRTERPHEAAFSATRAVTAAFHDTVDLLIKPLDAARWLKLSILCLFLGGGTPSAAFNWSLGSLPGDLGSRELAWHVRQVFAVHLWLIVLAVVLAIALLLTVLYLRSVFRFVLVDAILKREVRFRPGLKETRRMGRSYFWWLLGALVAITMILAGCGAMAYPYLRTAVAGGVRSLAFWTTLTTVLVIDILIGLMVALAIVLTDDFVVPIMYAERLTLASGWRKLAPRLKADPWGFAAYVFVRFMVAVGTSIAMLFLLFPLLLGLFSGAIISGALVVLGLRVAGFHWAWNPLTLSLTGLGFSLLIGLVLVVLSVVGMPAQVLIQDFGIRFIAPRVPSVAAVLPRTPNQINLSGQ
jgi:hypothetical protein